MEDGFQVPNSQLPPAAEAQQLQNLAAQYAALAHHLNQLAQQACPPVAVSMPEEMDDGKRTTVMIRNLPNDYTRDEVLKLLDELGFQGKYDFFYLPMDFKNHVGLGYAFLNMTTFQYAQEIMARLEGFDRWKMESGKKCTVAWGSPLQGLEAHINRYRDCPLMHPEVPKYFKPMLFSNGVEVEFPEPTKPLRKPRIKKENGSGTKLRSADPMWRLGWRS